DRGEGGVGGREQGEGGDGPGQRGERGEDGWRRRGAAGGGREGKALALEGADVHGPDPAQAALVGGGDAGAGGPGAEGRAAGQQGHGLRRPAVVAQGGQQRGAADQVVAAGEGAKTDVRETPVAGDDRVGQRGRAAEEAIGNAADEGGGVAADGAVGQRGRAVVEHAAADGAGVAADGAVGQRGRGSLVVKAPGGQAADDEAGVAADGAVGQRERSAVEHAAAVIV